MKEDGRMQNKASKISTYFLMEKWVLLLVTITGLIYNIGLAVVPYMEGQLLQRLIDVLQGIKPPRQMFRLSVLYVLLVLFVQGTRYYKRLYVRYFANNTNRRMKQKVYRVLVHSSRDTLDAGKAGSQGDILTKAISDVEACVEGMRKATTEVFDTGIAMIAYLVLLFTLDWRLTFISLIFPPIALYLAQNLKKTVTLAERAAKSSAGRLSSATLDRAENALTYRMFGEEENQNRLYEEKLTDYEKASIKAHVLSSSAQPIYQGIAMISVFFIILIGAENVNGNGFTGWNIAAFTAYLACYVKMAIKISKTGKLFNAVQKARVSWNRILPFLKEADEIPDMTEPALATGTAPVAGTAGAGLELKNVSFSFGVGGFALENLNLVCRPGSIIGITGSVASGKSAIGRVLLNEVSYTGEILLNGKNLRQGQELNSEQVLYLSHDPELLSDTIENNIQMGLEGDVSEVLEEVCLTEEVAALPDGIQSLIGAGGTRLSGGQQARLALARTLYHERQLTKGVEHSGAEVRVLVLDDPFAAVDKMTEQEIFKNLREHYAETCILLISHRLSLFKELSGVLFLQNGTGVFSTHEKLCRENEEYARLFAMQEGGDL